MNDEKIVTAIVNAARIKATNAFSGLAIFVIIFICITSSTLFTNTTTTLATIKNSSCEAQDGSCNITVEYTVNDQVYTNSFNTQDKSILDKTTININYETNNPNNINYDTSSKWGTVFIMLIILLAFAGFGYYYYTVMTNKDFAVQQTLSKVIRY